MQMIMPAESFIATCNFAAIQTKESAADFVQRVVLLQAALINANHPGVSLYLELPVSNCILELAMNSYAIGSFFILGQDAITIGIFANIAKLS